MEQSIHGFSVPFAFPVCFTWDTFAPDNHLLVDTLRRLEPSRRHRVLVVIDSHVATAHPTLTAEIDAYVGAHADALILAAPPVVVPGGETVKNDMTHPFLLLKHVNDVGLDRQSFIVVIGGGAVLDMASFAAAIAHRGIRVVRMPTTVLAQADSGVAVKNGINLFGKKNFVGTFVPPFAVINDTRFLESLDKRDVIGGVVEAIKVALLRDPSFFESLEASVDRIVEADREVLAALIERSARLHLAHICGNGDPFELGSARPLDFGHWAAHKLESITAHRLRHGEAVAIGMALDLVYSVRVGYLEHGTAERILTLLEAVGFELWDEAVLERDTTGGLSLIAGLQEFREHLGGELHITLLRGIGEGFEVTSMDETQVRASIGELAARAARRGSAARSVNAAPRGR
jgi:3-dehydroquinate synthase